MQSNKHSQISVKSLRQHEELPEYQELSDLELETIAGGKGGRSRDDAPPERRRHHAGSVMGRRG